MSKTSFKWINMHITVSSIFSQTIKPINVIITERGIYGFNDFIHVFFLQKLVVDGYQISIPIAILAMSGSDNGQP